MGPEKVMFRAVTWMENSLFWRLKSAEQGENTTFMNNFGSSLLTIAAEKYGGVD